jgi:hypothetical protein
MTLLDLSSTLAPRVRGASVRWNPIQHRPLTEADDPLDRPDMDPELTGQIRPVLSVQPPQNDPAVQLRRNLVVAIRFAPQLVHRRLLRPALPSGIGVVRSDRPHRQMIQPKAKWLIAGVKDHLRLLQPATQRLLHHPAVNRSHFPLAVRPLDLPFPVAPLIE